MLRHLSSIDDIAAADWDALFSNPYPFTRHAFLSALERHDCASPDNGWTACHLLSEGADGTLRGAMPLYVKAHSYGEFVFDFQWARASEQLGQPYYPKLLNAAPFTPVTGPRIGAIDTAARQQVATALPGLVAESGLSSAHALFLDEADAAAHAAAGGLIREDVQFHWYNRGHENFDGFLQTLSSDKRKKIRRERRRVAEAGLRFEWHGGDALSQNQWQRVYALYASTYAMRGQEPYLSLDFFLDYGRAADTPMQLALAFDGATIVACALFLEAGDTLYGRHWGAAADYHSLHFETCYYQGIERCIARGLHHFDAGTQGMHKLARGFDPVVTRSAHHLADPRLAQAVARYLQQERAAVAAQQDALQEHSAYRSDDDGKPGSSALAGPA